MAAHSGSHGSAHVFPIRMYVGTLLILMVLMVLTIVAAYFPLNDVVLGPLRISGSFINNLVALTIATVKATFVILYFMHVKFSTKLTKIYAISGFLWFFLLFLILLDYGTRAWEPVPTWEKFEGSALERQRGEKQDETAVRPR